MQRHCRREVAAEYVESELVGHDRHVVLVFCGWYSVSPHAMHWVRSGSSDLYPASQAEHAER